MMDVLNGPQKCHRRIPLYACGVTSPHTHYRRNQFEVQEKSCEFFGGTFSRILPRSYFPVLRVERQSADEHCL
jgi:hypothetical protein